jgi:hypothetical protein
MNKKTYELSGETTPGNVPGSYKEPAIGWMTGFLLTICFVGLLTLLPLRKVRVRLLGARCLGTKHPWSSSLSPSLIFHYIVTLSFLRAFTI